MLKVEGLNTHYGASHVLHGVDLELVPGRISAILGRNGVGKTTTVKSIMGLVRPSAGRIFLAGEEREQQLEAEDRRQRRDAA